MPNLTSDATDAIRSWLRERDWDYQRLADECNTLPGVDPDDWSAGGVRNAVNGYDPVRRGRITRLALVTQAHPTSTFPKGLSYDDLVGKNDEPKPDPQQPQKDEPDGPKVEPTAPPGRRNGKHDRHGPPRTQTMDVSAGVS